jgi:hypothetical protein
MGSQATHERDAGYRRLQREADRICFLIVASDYPAVDVAIEIRKLREYALEEFPGRGDLFRMIYESRFRRLWRQFRPGTEELAVW